MNPYKEAVRVHLQDLLDTGMTQREVAALLQYDNPNNVCMLLSPRYPTYVLSPLKLRFLQNACGLSAAESYGLFRLLMASTKESTKVLNLDLSTLDWLESTILSGVNASANTQEHTYA